jgi:hypothetical protein
MHNVRHGGKSDVVFHAGVIARGKEISVNARSRERQKANDENGSLARAREKKALAGD